MEKYVLAARQLYRHNYSLEDFIVVCETAEISTEWSIAAWVAINATQGIVGKYPRYLEAGALGQIRLTDRNHYCRLCGTDVQFPQKSWHKECWSALEPFTSGGWHAQLYKAQKLQKHCDCCGKIAPTEGDHIVPIALGGLPYKNNLQLLCSVCHKAKTVEDLKLIKAAKSHSSKA